MKKIHVYIIGKVTGVFFRSWTKEQADGRGIHGWIRNVYDRPEIFGKDAGVEAVFQGEEEKVDQLIELIKIGPPLAGVDDVRTEIEETDTSLTHFEILK